MEHNCACLSKKSAEEFTEEQWKAIDDIIAKYKDKAGSLIPVLEEVQAVTGYLPERVQRRVAKGLNIPLSQVYGVVTFYSFFTMTPRGKHQIKVCLGTACHVKGAKRIMEYLTDKIRIEPGDCTEDRQFSLDVVRCLGACGLAPVMVIDNDIQKQVKAAKLEQIMSKYR